MPSSPVVFSVPWMAPGRHTFDAQQMSGEIVNAWMENIVMCVRGAFEGEAGTGEIIRQLEKALNLRENFPQSSSTTMHDLA